MKSSKQKHHGTGWLQHQRQRWLVIYLSEEDTILVRVPEK
jgi:hypothetical protein